MESTVKPSRKIGIEIEVVAPIIGRGQDLDVQQLLAEVLTNQGMQTYARSYTHQPVPRGYLFCVEHDTSLQDESRYAGIKWAKIEVKTRPMIWEEVKRILPQALEVIRYVGARTNASTGLHVHHHVPEVIEQPQVIRNLMHLYWRFHQVIYGLIPPSRKSNTYCQPPQQSDATMFDSASSYPRLCGKLNHLGRYWGLNLSNLTNQERLTVEWRMHGGTTDWAKIKTWVLATQRWLEHSIQRSCHYKPEPVANTQAGLNSLLLTTGLKPNSRIYRRVDKDMRLAGKFLLRRWKHFNLPRKMKSKAA